MHLLKLLNKLSSCKLSNAEIQDNPIIISSMLLCTFATITTNAPDSMDEMRDMGIIHCKELAKHTSLLSIQLDDENLKAKTNDADAVKIAILA